MTFTELLTEAKKLTPPDQIRLATELLQWFNAHWLHSTPASTPPLAINQTIAQLRQLQKTIALHPNSIRDMIEEGRRF
ncbi:MAG: hypothetical protein VKJ85_00230 [Prochlorothrix sp.]|nr:hypothetical protein [Prochlorothrix sp.]